MNKLQIQRRVLQHGEALPLTRFEWDEKTRTFSTEEEDLVLDFSGIEGYTFKTGFHCVFKTGGYCNFITEGFCVFFTSEGCNFTTGHSCTFTTGHSCTFTTDNGCTFTTGHSCTFRTEGCCNFVTGSNCHFAATERYCTFKTGGSCTFITGDDCTFDTGSDCTFDTGDDCIFSSTHCSLFHVGERSVIIRKRPFFEIIKPKEKEVIQLCPENLGGYLSNGLYKGKPHIVADGILSEIVSKKSNVYKVINRGETKKSFLVEKEINNKKYYSHGATLKEAKESLVFKISDRDLSKWEHLTLQSEISFEDAVMLYRDITGACSEGTRYFVDNNIDKKKDKYSIAELLKITKNQYGYSEFKNFFNK